MSKALPRNNPCVMLALAASRRCDGVASTAGASGGGPSQGTPAADTSLQPPTSLTTKNLGCMSMTPSKPMACCSSIMWARMLSTWPTSVMGSGL